MNHHGTVLRKLLERSGRDSLMKDLLRIILQRLLLALDYLHTDRKLIHTDIKSDNILHLIEESSIPAAFEEAEIAQPSPRKKAVGREIYVSRTLDMPASIGEPILCDFGNAVYGTKINNNDVYPDVYRCPEVMLRLPWTYSADIWNVGAMIWDIFEGKHLFSGQDPKRARYTTRAHPTEVISLLGPPPPELIKRGERSAEWFDGNGKWLEPDEDEPDRLPLLPPSSLEDAEENLNRKDKELFLNFIKSMLQWEPEKRKTARELLNDPWLTRSYG
ncbi:70045321-d6a8-409d-a8f6-030ff2037465-CDS [Sclerotinia trifoliorum]|uniref:70045321-d6a8-409d-a8f6-030ff2037465-CDS n=1 Tax=Sclerotinia trifoliorum TaxID=28548 RepID=A0A8H2VZ35_9HELO|nr:70045321-d6a8-409d-a8f6-030ff2037465-CDS [Sclerotinia trifoliorum]